MVEQIAVFFFPALVLLSLFLEHRLTFVIGPVAIGALVLMALSVWQITGDGEAAAFEGWALVRSTSSSRLSRGRVAAWSRPQIQPRRLNSK